MESWSTDKLVETLHWIQDRRNYCKACNKPAPNDNTIQYAAMDELSRRGLPHLVPAAPVKISSI